LILLMLPALMFKDCLMVLISPGHTQLSGILKISQPDYILRCFHLLPASLHGKSCSWN